MAVEFGEIGAPPAGVRDGALGNVAVEVAIGTLGDTERPMDVDAEARVRAGRPGCAAAGQVASGRKQAATSLLKATARWLMACLASGSISPKVMS